MNTSSIVINTGEKRVMINDDPTRVIVFNPTDVLFAERFYTLLGELKEKLTEFNLQGQELGRSEKDSDGMPVNMAAQIQLQIETCNYMREKVDQLFGDGTSQTAFGDVRNLEVFRQFFDGILPFFETTRVEKVASYTTAASARRSKRKK
ncbi:MAG: hypothetical protein IPL32_18100 [Chloracidobacterium sp.]|nr:hypothetical protein [Chloracidobacterium sp.]